MARIPLRAYNKEIDQMVENGQTAEAVAHCKYILKYFPKHIDTYRLLGQAFLTDQRYTEAADILQRVLSVIPDDFISQIGMSIIREDEGNLDAAIYHMEKAFEVQPSKSAIQGELRKLYGRRDGMEPPKIRLTRGALVRMYMRGELYPQAIAEVRAALADDPQQLDLQVILARLYALSGQKVQAVEICNRLVNRLPYCLEANRILAEILPGTTRSEDARVFSDRLHALDPYTALLPDGSQDPAGAPDAAVQLERLEYNAATEASEQPEWARSAGVAWDAAEQPEVPSWLEESGQPTAAQPGQPAAPEAEPEQEMAAPAEIPDWMSAAGWGLSSGEAVEGLQPLSAQAEEEPAEEGLAFPGQIPDWLQSLAPETPVLEPETTPEEDQAWLEKMVGGPAAPVTEPETVTPVAGIPLPPVEETSAVEASPAELPGEEALPDWLQELKPEEPVAGVEAPQALVEPLDSAGDLPDWLQEMKTGQPPAEIEAPETPEAAQEPAESVPDWLQSLKAEESPAVAEKAVESAAAQAVPDWLQELSGAAEQESPRLEETIPTGESAPAEAAQALPDWLQDLSAAAEQESPRMEETIPAGESAPAEAAEALPDWLQELTAGEAPADTPASEPVPAPEELPEWLQQQAPEAKEAAPAEALPDWLAEAEEAPAAAVETTAQPIEFEQMTADAEPPAEIEEPQGIIEAETQPALELPEMPIEVEKPAEMVETAPELPEQPVTAQQIAPALNPEEDLDSALAWLESLAAKQGASEAELLTQPEQRMEAAPAWIKEAETTQPVEEPLAVEAPQMETGEVAFPMEPAAPVVEALNPPQEIEEAAAVVESIEPDAGEPVQAEAGAWEFPLEAVEPALETEALAAATVEPVAEVEQPAEAEQAAPEFLFEEPVQAVDDTAPTQPVRVAPRVETAEPVLTEITQAVAEGTEETAAVAPEAQPVEDATAREMVEEVAAPEMVEVVSVTEESPAEVPVMEQEIPAEAAVEAARPAVQAEMPEDIDSALAWLEGLAAKQGADEDTLLTAPESRSETPPEWVEAEAAQQPETLATPEGEMEAAAAQLPEVEEAETALPIEPVGEAAQTEEPAMDLPEAIETPEEVAPSTVAREWVIEAETATSGSSEEPIPDWLQDLEDVDRVEETAPAETEPASELPRWLQDLEIEPEEPIASETSAGEWAPENAATETAAVEMEAPRAERLETTVETPIMAVEQPAAEPAEVTGVPVEEQTKPVPVAVPAEPVVTGDLLEKARRALEHGDIETALEVYENLTGSGAQLEDIIHDLRDATYRFPMNTDIWQALGDAYRQANHVQDALDAYTKAIELIR